MDFHKAFMLFFSPDSFILCLEFFQEFSLDVTDSLFSQFPIIYIFDDIHALILFGFTSSQHIENQCVFAFL